MTNLLEPTMPRKPKKFEPPPSIWVVFDLEEKHPVSVLEPKDVDDIELFDDEVIVKYTVTKTRRTS